MTGSYERSEEAVKYAAFHAEILRFLFWFLSAQIMRKLSGSSDVSMFQIRQRGHRLRNSEAWTEYDIHAKNKYAVKNQKRITMFCWHSVI